MSESEANSILRELLKWTKVTSIPTVRGLLESTLTTPEKKKAYEASTGRNVREVADIAHASKSSVAIWWDQWIKLGLAEVKPAKGGKRAVRSFSLEDFGIGVAIPNAKGRISEAGND